MAITNNHPFTEYQFEAFTSSIGTTPIVAYVRAPFRGKVTKVGVIQSAAVTGTSTVTTAIAGTNITGGAVAVTAGSAGSLFSASPTAANQCNEDDVISFTPAGATGASVTATCFVVIQKQS